MLIKCHVILFTLILAVCIDHCQYLLIMMNKLSSCLKYTESYKMYQLMGRKGL